MPSRPPWETSERETFRVTFDEDVEAYDRTRPVAPRYVFDDLVELAGLHPGSSVVEVGPGTGQATRPLAERRLQIVALELGPHLAARARRNLAAFTEVEVVTTSYEAWDPDSARFDAVFASNSFHWVDPAIRFHKSATVLRPCGHLIVLATPWVIPDDADRFWWDVQDDYVAVGGGWVDPATKHPDRTGDLGSEVRASGLFEAPTIRRYLFEITFTADDYALNLSTQSGIKELPPAAQAELISRIRRRILEGGGTVAAHLLAALTVARLRS
ncbi:class I SAM-dependent methyltransferase [Iamia sp.]|uniref:class I SAM-dependent methyltransferase n=1 Tax=Iamia sp. TaxID=2722710 RepID=UPI002C70A633|nr:class I SAM-dependent methyltransferase [Iamia sp.]HXH58379.1 class I SAM-dependent methyltransferase [Iamia sp.]